MGVYSDKFESTVIEMDGVHYSIAKMKEPIDISEQKESPIGSIVSLINIKEESLDQLSFSYASTVSFSKGGGDIKLWIKLFM